MPCRAVTDSVLIKLISGTLAHQDWLMMNGIGYANGPTKCIPAKKSKKMKKQALYAPKAQPVESIASMPIQKTVGNITSASMDNPGSMVAP